MNIVIRTVGDRTIVRPDTTWEKNSDDFFPPDFVDLVSWSPVMFARVSKPGRSVGPQFARRYYDSIGFGLLLYPENLIDGSSEGYATASCLDHTSYLPVPLFNLATAASADNRFTVRKDGRELFSISPGDPLRESVIGISLIEKLIVETTRMVYIRKGDFVAAELCPRKKLLSRDEPPARITASFCDNTVLDFEIRY